MRLPNAQLALIGKEKITDYLLNPAHPDNGGKAAFFRSHGFRPDEWETLAQKFRKLAQVAEVSENLETQHGTKYVVAGNMETPGGKTPMVRTIWISGS